MKRPPRHDALPLLVLAAVVAALCLRWWLLSAVDLVDFPGAAGGQSIASAAAGKFHAGWEVWLIGLVAPLTDWDLTAAAHLVGWLSSAAMVVGASLGAGALAGWRGALAGAVVAGVWSQSVLVGLLVGPDPPAIGAAWLGVGLAWSARRGGLAAVLAAPGAALVVLALTIKALALPALGLLLLTPIISRGFSRLTSSAALLAGGWWAWERLQPGELSPDFASPELSVAPFVDGLWAIVDMTRGWPDGLMEQVVGAALLAGLLPGPRWGSRLVAALLSVSIMALTATTLGGRLCPRLLIGASFGGVVMMAVLAASLSRGRLWIIGLFGIGLGLDGWAWLSAWSQERTDYADARPLNLPEPPALWAARYSGASYQANNHRLRDITTTGGATLARLARGGIGMPPLRDRRDAAALAITALADTPGTLLHPRLCCTEPTPACASRLLDELDAAGMTLVVPRQLSHETIVDRPFEAWSALLVSTAEAAGGLRADGVWWVRSPTGSGGPPPCPQSASERGEATDWPPKPPR